MGEIGFILIIAGAFFVHGFFWHGFACVTLGAALLVADRAWPTGSAS